MVENSNKGDNKTIHFKYARFSERFVAITIDCLIMILFIPVTRYFLINSFRTNSVLQVFFENFFTYCIIIFLIVKYGGTPGKMVLGIRIVDRNGIFLSVPKSILRNLPFILHSLVVILQLSFAVESYTLMDNRHSVESLIDVSKYLHLYSESFFPIRYGIALLFVLECSFTLLNSQKRAGHDFLAGSYVIYKESYEDINKLNKEANMEPQRTIDPI